jgi:hypothetical protein
MALSHKCILFSSLFLLVLLLNSCEWDDVEAKLSIDLTLNPDKVSAGKISVITTAMRNEGNATNITGIEIVTPWHIQ